MSKRLVVYTATVIAVGLSLGAVAGSQYGRLPAGVGLHYVDEGETAKIAYGAAESDVVGLMLQCSKGSGVVEITDVARRGTEPRITLASQNQRSAFGAEVQSFGGAPILLALAQTSAPALQAFRSSGKVEVQSGEVRYRLAAAGDERVQVERFFTACETA